MAENITPSNVSSGGGPEFLRSPRGIEMVKLQGSSTAADDTSTVYTCTRISKPAFVIGAAIGSTISGATVVFKSKVALGDDAMYVIVCEAI
jgi:hypothetical protein